MSFSSITLSRKIASDIDGRALAGHGSAAASAKSKRGLRLPTPVFRPSRLRSPVPHSAPVDRDTGLICDQTIALNGFYASFNSRVKLFGTPGLRPTLTFLFFIYFGGTWMEVVPPPRKTTPGMPFSQ
jgi:hypothetical protein